MTKGQAKIEIDKIFVKLDFGDISICKAESEICKLLDKIYIDLCFDPCGDGTDLCNPPCETT